MFPVVSTHSFRPTYISVLYSRIDSFKDKQTLTQKSFSISNIEHRRAHKQKSVSLSCPMFTAGKISFDSLIFFRICCVRHT